MSDTVTGTLTDFLLARIDEDVESARGATEGRWFYCPGKFGDEVGNLYSQADDVIHAVAFDRDDDNEGCVEMEDAEHIARWDPARVLAECEAKRQIINRHESRADYFESLDAVIVCCGACSTPEGEPCPDLALLALPYADHPDFRREWRG